MRVLCAMLCAALLQVSTLTRLQDFRLKVREIEVEGINALRSLTDLRSFDLEVCPFRQGGLCASCTDSLKIGVVSTCARQSCNSMELYHSECMLGLSAAACGQLKALEVSAYPYMLLQVHNGSWRLLVASVVRHV